MGVDFAALIAKQREEQGTVRRVEVPVVFGGVKLVLQVDKVADPDVWDALTAENPPRVGVDADRFVGYNPRAVSRAYPCISVDGDRLDSETWGEMFAVLDSVWRNKIEGAIWSLNVNETVKALSSLGKAPAGRKSPSPAN